MKTDDLIQKLSTELVPVKPGPSPLILTVLFGFVGLALVGLSFFVMSARDDLREQLSDLRFLFELGLSFLLAMLALTLAVFLSRPGQQSKIGALKKGTVGILIFALIYDGFRVAQLSQSEVHLGLDFSGIECFLAVFGYSIVLGATLLIWLRREASVTPGLSGLVLGAACVALGNVSIAFFCGFDNGMHVLIWHFVFPLLAALAAGLAAGRIFLRW